VRCLREMQVHEEWEIPAKYRSLDTTTETKGIRISFALSQCSLLILAQSAMGKLM